MNRKTLAILMAILMVLTMTTPALAGPPQPEAIRRGDIIDIGPVLRAKDLPIVGTHDFSADDRARSLQVMATQAYTVGNTLTWLALDNYNGYYFYTTYTVMTITAHAEVWVQNDLNYYNTDGTLNTIHPDAKDPEYITMDRINYLANTFDTIIYPTDTDFFGVPDSHDGSDAVLGSPGYYEGDGDKIVILVSNVRDENFYDPVSSGSFIIGFYSPSFERYSDRNMITIDSKQWNDRMGNSGHPTRAFDDDNTLAHEFQHLIHDDYSPDEEYWLNEGMSGFAEFLNGYWFTEDLGGRTQWQTWPENSLLLWGDRPGEILADYQLSNAFILYTTGRIGGVYTDTAKLTQQPADSILGFNTWLSNTAATNPAAVGLTFDDIFEDFRTAMLFGGDTDDAQPMADWNSGFISEYESPVGIDIPAANLGVLRDNLDSAGYDSPGAPPFGTDFIEVCWSAPISNTLVWPVVFDGDEMPAPTDWSAVAATTIYTPSGTVAGDVLHSGHSDLTDNFVIFGPVAITDTDMLTFDHFYNIEDEWDYGFVQVTTDTTGVQGWTSLAITGTITDTDADAHDIIVANVPGFSGFSGGWITATYDIGADYGGEDILLAFRYSTDWGGGGSDGDYPAGWAIDNVEIGATAITTGSLAGSRSIGEVRNAGPTFDVEFATWGDGDAITVTNVYTVDLDANQFGTFDLTNVAHTDPGFDEPGERGVFMITAMLDRDLFADLVGGMPTAYADYSLVGLPPSICTSDMDAYGDTHAGATHVYAGEVVTAAVHADNLGSSPNITTTGPALVYVGIEVPEHTTYTVGSATAGAAYTDDLSTVAGTFPAVAGVYWTGLVTRTKDLAAGFTADADLVDGDTITVTVHFANDATAMPDQYFADEDTVDVISAFGLSGLLADVDPVFPGLVAQFTAKVLNLSHGLKEVQLVADHPTDTTFVSVMGATVVASSTTQITVTQTISPYATSGAGDVTFRWMLGPSYDFGDMITSEMVLTDLTTGETFDLSAMAKVDASYWLYLPLVMKNSTGTALLP